MTLRCRRAGLAVAAWLAPVTSPLAGQAEGTVGLGASIVEYDGFLASGAVVFAPALRFDSPRLVLGGQGSWTLFESGNGVLQGNAAAAWLAGSRGWWRLELSGSAGVSEYATEPVSGHLLAGARLHIFANTSGGWLGTNAGASFGGPSGVPVELVAAGWSVRDRLALVGTMTLAWQSEVSHLDLLGALRWAVPRVELELRAGARVSDTFTEGYGEVTAQIPISRQFAVSLGGGKYPSDPVRQVLGAKYLSAGLRLRAFGPRARSVPVHTTSVLRGRAIPTDEGGPPLEIVGSAEQRTLRVRALGAGSVELMADFTDWVAVRLVQVSPGVWEIQLPLPPGVHRVNLRLDGGPWSAPGGARLERTEFGGSVGILVVP